MDCLKDLKRQGPNNALRNRTIHRNYLAFLGLSALLLSHVAPAQAQTDNWTLDRDEYLCKSVWLTVDEKTIRLATSTNGNVISISAPVVPKGPVGEKTSTVVSLATDYPAMQTSISYTGGMDYGKATRATISLSGGGELIAWLSQGNRAFDLLNLGNHVGTFLFSGIADAHNVLKACKPIVPPPNRAVTPATHPSKWIDTDSFWRHIQKGISMGPIAADLLINDQGRVADCNITTSSGSAEVDRIFCREAKSKGRFKAATDAVGKHITANYPLRVSKIQL